jgi:SAM-dependent methyltransferase
MSPRATANRLVRAFVAALDRVNHRHPWNHNDHFQGWLLRRLPAARGCALDVGCGHGELLGLLRSRGRFARVVGVDPDAAMARSAGDRFADDAAVRVAPVSFFAVARQGDLLPDGGADLVTMVASLHHLAHEASLEGALEHARGLLAPGGRLLVVGPARPRVRADFAVDLASALLNPLVGLVKHPRRATPAEAERILGGAGPRGVVPMPMRDPDESFDDVVRAARALLPGARVRRRLWFRYTLEWSKA